MCYKGRQQSDRRSGLYPAWNFELAPRNSRCGKGNPNFASDNSTSFVSVRCTGVGLFEINQESSLKNCANHSRGCMMQMQHHLSGEKNNNKKEESKTAAVSCHVCRYFNNACERHIYTGHYDSRGRMNAASNGDEIQDRIS